MTMISTGDAGFMGANIVQDWLIGSDEPVINLDKLAYAASPEPLTSLQGDAHKLDRELRWKPTETFETAIRKTFEWYLSNPDWVANVQSGAYREWVRKKYSA